MQWKSPINDKSNLTMKVINFDAAYDYYENFMSGRREELMSFKFFKLSNLLEKNLPTNNNYYAAIHI